MPENAAPITVPAQSSSFTYEPPASEATPQEQAEFNDLLKDSISDISDEYNPKPAVDDTEAPAEDTAETVEPAAESTDATNGVSPEVARGMDRLVQREVALQAKESGVAAREAKMAAQEAELTSLRSAVPTKDLLAKFDTSPTDALKAMGKDPATVVRLMIAEQLAARGEPVPEGLQKFVEKAAQERRIAELEARIAQRDSEAKEAQVFSAVQHGAREYVKTVDGKKMPSLAKLFQTDPELAHSELMEEIRVMASKDPNSELTYPAAATSAEKRLARLHKAFTGSSASTTPTMQAGGQKPTTPNTAPVTKPPARPLKPWEQRNTDLDAAINEATREFDRAEAQRKSARK